MKHLKHLTPISLNETKESQTDFEYKEITRSEYFDKFLRKELITINNRTITLIKKTFPNLDIITCKIHFNNTTLEGNERIKLIDTNNLKSKYPIEIESYSDNWFIIKHITGLITSTYYLCDDTEGLIKCIKSITNK